MSQILRVPALLRPGDPDWQLEAARVLELTRQHYPWTAGAFDMPQQIANYVQTTLASPMTNASTTATLTSVAGLPTVGPFRLVIKDLPPATTFEIVEVASVNVGTGVVTFTTPFASGRGLEGTTAIAHSSGAAVGNDITAYMLLAAFANGVASLGGGTVAYKEATANQGGITTATDITGLTVTFTPPAGRLIRIIGAGALQSTVGADEGALVLADGGGTQLANSQVYMGAANNQKAVYVSQVFQPASVSLTYKLQAKRIVGTGTFTFVAASPFGKGYILAEDIGPAA